jgi:hypothetical protein
MMHLDLHLTDHTELRAHSRVDEAGRPFAEITWNFHGHKSAAITLDRDGHLFPEELDQLADRLDRVHIRAAISAGS